MYSGSSIRLLMIRAVLLLNLIIVPVTALTAQLPGRPDWLVANSLATDTDNFTLKWQGKDGKVEELFRVTGIFALKPNVIL